KTISDLNKDIASTSHELENTPDLTKVLTVQNQLKSLPKMHDQKPVASRFFNYLSQVTPTKASISSSKIDFANQTITITGTADSLVTVNTFADTLKFTTYNTANSTSTKNAFSNVVLSNFSRDKSNAGYTLTLKFDKQIFSSASEITLTVPKITTTRSTVEQPTALFKVSQ
ncbi:MAG TPA: PilN domain-containing protein, partial [Ktedonobacteraceae bacterium]|nr:PilN domain-containing protein [Ktedonobacteraceae bacterium]